MIRLFLTALGFLTPLPVGKYQAEPAQLARAMRLFPLVGLVIGLVLVLIKILCVWVGLADMVTATLLVFGLAALSGGIHLDGLSDMCDGFYGGRTKDEILKIMRDPHIGVMGVLGILFVVMLKWSILSSILPAPDGWKVIIITPVLSRWAMVLATAMGPYPDGDYAGIGKVFVANISKKDWQVATIIAVALAILLMQLAGVALAIIAVIVAIVMVLSARRVIGGVTGDVLGAINEVVEVSVLLFGYILMIGR